MNDRSGGRYDRISRLRPRPEPSRTDVRFRRRERRLETSTSGDSFPPPSVSFYFFARARLLSQRKSLTTCSCAEYQEPTFVLGPPPSVLGCSPLLAVERRETPPPSTLRSPGCYESREASRLFESRAGTRTRNHADRCIPHTHTRGRSAASAPDPVARGFRRRETARGDCSGWGTINEITPLLENNARTSNGGGRGRRGAYREGRGGQVGEKEMAETQGEGDERRSRGTGGERGLEERRDGRVVKSCA